MDGHDHSMHGSHTSTGMDHSMHMDKHMYMVVWFDCDAQFLFKQ